jgi:indolepyruvate ferredoxin oxidoreductase
VNRAWRAENLALWLLYSKRSVLLWRMTLERPQRELEDRYTVESGEVMLSGIQALVRVTLDQRRLDERRGLRTGLFVTGYEGSPLGGLDMEMLRAKRHLEYAGVTFRPGLNEELAATAVSGTQSLGLFPGRRVDGVTGIWYGKNPGLDRAADAIRHGNLSGTAPNGGAVAWIGDDPASKSSTVPSSCIPMCRNLLLPVLAPGNVEQILEFGLHAIAISRFTGSWVGMQIVTDIADASGIVDVGRAVARATAVDFDARGEFRPTLMLPPGNLDAELDLMENRLERALEFARRMELNAITYNPERPRFALVGVGFGYEAIVRSLEELAIDEQELQRLGIRLIQLAMPWPVEVREIRRLCADVETVLVVEDKLEFVELLVRDALYGTSGAPRVLGKRDADGRNLLPRRSFVTADDVSRALGALLDDLSACDVAKNRLDQLRPRARIALPVTNSVSRTPFFCSGCPHSTSTRASQDQLVGLGIGCHSLANMDTGARRGTITGITQMGGEGAQWLGIAPFTDDPHFIQNLGDGTFHHSGSLAIRAAVAAGVTMTYKILYNDAVAMTGGQRPQGKLDVPALCRLLEAEGVKRVVVTTPEPSLYRQVALPSLARVRHRDQLQDVQRELAVIDGVTVLIHDDRCAAEKRRLRKRGRLETPVERIVINERVCEGCGDCGEQSTCLSLFPTTTEFGRKTQVHQSSCNFDRSCLKGNCPSFVLVTPKRGVRQTHRTVELPTSFPMPTLKVPRTALIRMPGVGGTGVVTVSAILQMAAYLDGLYAGGLDQIGLAQKGGPVVSDVRISDEPIGGQLRASVKSADVILGFDTLGATSVDTLNVADPLRTIAVINSSVIPTSAMVTDVDAAARISGHASLDAVTRSSENVVIDAGGLAESLFDDHFATNMILLGAAFQHGCLPVSGPSIEQAIALNGASVASNIQAFRWGRTSIASPELVAEALHPGTKESQRVGTQPSTRAKAMGLEGDLLELVGTRFDELVRYQNRKYAERFITAVSTIFELERRSDLDDTFPLSRAYASGLFKLMAYKDEYEVARLHLSDRQRHRAEYGKGVKTKVLLHPPIFKALGMKQKIAVGRSAFVLFRTLYALRFLRGSPLDVFGYAEMRKMERNLIGEYEETVAGASAQLAPDTLALAVSIAELTDLIRGYDEVKMNNVGKFRRETAKLQSALLASAKARS